MIDPKSFKEMVATSGRDRFEKAMADAKRAAEFRAAAGRSCDKLLCVISEYIKREADRDIEIEALKHDIGEYVRMSSEQASEIELLRRQLEWVEAYAQDMLNTNSKDMDDWRGDVHHIANSARAALSQGEQK